VPVRRLPTPPPPPVDRSTSTVELQPTVPIDLTAPGPASPSEPKPPARRGRGAMLWACLGSAALVSLGVLWVAMQPGELEVGEPSIAGLQTERDAPPAPDPPAEEDEDDGQDPPSDRSVAEVEVGVEATPEIVEDPPSADPTAEPEEASGGPSQDDSRVADNRTSTPREVPSAVVDEAAIKDLLRQAKEAQAQGNAKQARALFEQVLRHRPRNMAALEALSNLAFTRGDHQGAIGYLSRAVKVAPRNADLRIRLGDAHFKLGQYAKARTHFEQAQKLGHPSAARRLARVNEAQGS
jgi:TolA-binding protein